MEFAMTQTTSRFFDDIARLVTDAAGAAQGLRREVDTLVRAQMDRLMQTMDVVKREEFEAVRDMAAKAREENDRLAARLAALEQRLADEPRGQASAAAADTASGVA
jgi:BMFP domain-containing protein YqiC